MMLKVGRCFSFGYRSHSNSIILYDVYTGFGVEL